MKVLHVIRSMSPERGGVAAMVRGLTAALAADGVSCEIASTQGYPTGSDPLPIPGVLVHVFDAGQLARVWTGYSRDLARFLDAETARFDLVHIHELWNFGGYAASRAASRHGVPYLLSVHGNLNEWALRQKAVKKWVYMKAVQGRVLRSADALHTITRLEADRIAALGFQTPVFTAPNGVAPNLLNAFDRADSSKLLARCPELSGKRVILFLGRLHAIKGLDLLARSFAAIAQDLGDAALLVTGPDQDGSQGRMEAVLRAAGLLDRVVFAGMVTGDDKLAAFAAADLFVLPSYSEGFSVSVLEALATRLPVVISEGCNFPEVAESEAGFVVPAEDAAVARAIGTLLSDESLRIRMGANGRRLVEECYTWPAIAGTVATRYRALIKERRQPD